MKAKIELVKETISCAEGELKSIIDEYAQISLDTMVNRVIRWHKRTQEKLAKYLIDTEVFSFSKIINGAVLNKKEDFVAYQRDVKEYFVELRDDLARVMNVGNGFETDEVEVFISHAWANDDVVLAIDQWLRNKGVTTRIDKRDFFAGSRIGDEIIRVMGECKVILIFHSKQSKDKPWMQFERELAVDIEMSSRIEGKEPPRIIYIVIDDTPLPDIREKNRIAIIAKGKFFNSVCDEIYQNILRIPRPLPKIDLTKWENCRF